MENPSKMEGKPQALTSKYFTTLRSLNIAGDLQCALLLLWLTRYIYKGGNLETDYDMIHLVRGQVSTSWRNISLLLAI
jgi:hypothetical protein